MGPPSSVVELVMLASYGPGTSGPKRSDGESKSVRSSPRLPRFWGFQLLRCFHLSFVGNTRSATFFMLIPACLASFPLALCDPELFEDIERMRREDLGSCSRQLEKQQWVKKQTPQTMVSEVRLLRKFKRHFKSFLLGKG